MTTEEAIADIANSLTGTNTEETIADTFFDIGIALRMIGDAIYPAPDGGGTDAAGIEVNSLTEAVMGVTAGLFAIAEAINRLASKE